MDGRRLQMGGEKSRVLARLPVHSHSGSNEGKHGSYIDLLILWTCFMVNTP